MKKVIVSGATGFIGGALTKKLLEMGITVYGIDINAECLNEMKRYGNFVPVVADFSVYHKLHEFIKERNFDCFIHTAWMGSFGAEDYYNYHIHNQNINATCTASEMASAIGVKRFVFCGSSYQNMVSVDANFPVNYYGIVKKAAADYCMAICYKNQIECNIAILTNTFGVGDKRSQKAVNKFISKMLANETLNLIQGNRANDWAYIDDTVSGIISVCESPNYFKRYYVGHDNITSFKDKLLQMKEALGSLSDLNFGTYQDNTFVDYSTLSPRELTNDTGFECKSDFKESILKTAEWVRTLNF